MIRNRNSINHFRMDKIIKSKAFAFFATLFVMLTVTMTLFSPLANHIKLIIRILFIAGFFISWRLFQKHDFTNAKDLAFAFMVLKYCIFSCFLFYFNILESRSGDLKRICSH